MPEIISRLEPTEHFRTGYADRTECGIFDLIATQIVDISDLIRPEWSYGGQTVIKYANSVSGTVFVFTERYERGKDQDANDLLANELLAYDTHDPKCIDRLAASLGPRVISLTVTPRELAEIILDYAPHKYQIQDAGSDIVNVAKGTRLKTLI